MSYETDLARKIRELENRLNAADLNERMTSRSPGLC